MITYKLPTQYQRETLRTIQKSHPDYEHVFFWIDESEKIGIECVWLPGGEVATRTINDGIITSWAVVNFPLGLSYQYTKCAGGCVDYD